MCYLCTKDDPFQNASQRRSQLDEKKRRAAEIKNILRDIDEDTMCHVGDETVKRLREEQRELARSL